MPSRNILFRRTTHILSTVIHAGPGCLPHGLNTEIHITIGGKNDRILFILSPAERMSYPDMRSICLVAIRPEAPNYIADSRLKNLYLKNIEIKGQHIHYLYSNIKVTLTSCQTKSLPLRKSF